MDPRFDTTKDPRFRRAPRDVRKIKVDKRFAHMFDDVSFVERASVDARGQKVRRSAGKLKLREFYSLADDSVVASDKLADVTDTAKVKQPRAKRKAATRKKSRELAPADEEDDDEEECDDEEPGTQHQQEDEEDEEDTSDGEDDDGDDDDDDEAIDPSIWENIQTDVPTGDATKRLSIMGCDWDHVSASDLLVMLRTYLASKESLKSGARTGAVEKVSIYPSNYGLEMMAKEAESGPQIDGAVDAALTLDDEHEETAQKTQEEALRRYQIQRTRYYYAVAFCDSAATAAWLYDQLDGMDAIAICPSSLDLRFVPDDLDFPHAPSFEATEVPKKYKGPDLLRSSVGHSRVQCSWDEAPAHRKKDLMRKKFTAAELRDHDLEEYLASSSDEEGGGSGAEDLKRLVRGSDDEDGFFDEGNDDSSDDGRKEPEGDMEATFSLKATRLEDELAEKAKVQAKEGGRPVHTIEGGEKKSTWQQYLDKKKEKKKERRRKNTEELKARRAVGAGAEQPDGEGAGDLEILAAGAESDGEDHGFNVRGRRRTASKRAQKEALAGGSFKVDVNDERISKVFASDDFAIDPTHPEFRKSEGMDDLLRKKRLKKAKVAGTSRSSVKVVEASGAGRIRTWPKSKDSVSVTTPRSGSASVGGGLKLFASRTRKSDSGGGAAAEAAGGANLARATADAVGFSPAMGAPASGAPKAKKRRRTSA